MRTLLIALILTLPAQARAVNLALGPGIRGGSASTPSLMPAPVAMAWAVSLQIPLRTMDFSSVLPDMRGCMIGLSELRLENPAHWEPLGPVISQLDAVGVRPDEFAAMDSGRQQKLLVQAASSVAQRKRVQAAKLIFRIGEDRIAEEELDAVEQEANELQRSAMYLNDAQYGGVQTIVRRAAKQRAFARSERTLLLAENTAAALASYKKENEGERVLRTVIAPDGRKVRFVSSGTRYRVWYEGDAAPAVEYDLSKTDGDDIAAYNVERNGRRGVHVNGRVLWEDGKY
ncbi:MAG: hypothetical protein ABIJ96_09450 [Elusimicrobiota bacterium]